MIFMFLTVQVRLWVLLEVIFDNLQHSVRRYAYFVQLKLMCAISAIADVLVQ